MNYPRRHQYRRLSRAIATRAGGLIAAGGARLAGGPNSTEDIATEGSASTTLGAGALAFAQEDRQHRATVTASATSSRDARTHRNGAVVEYELVTRASHSPGAGSRRV